MKTVICTVKEIKDKHYGVGKPHYVVKTKEGMEFSVTEEQAKGLAIGTRLRYSLTRLDDGSDTFQSELDEAYVVIADLVEKGRALASKAQAAVRAKQGLAASLALNLAAIVWLWLK